MSPEHAQDRGDGTGDRGPAFDTEAAYDFLYLKATPIENIRLAHWRGDADDNAFWRVISRFQNPDGGWANGIEPDYQGSESSIHSTIEALRILVAHQQIEHPQVGRTVHFLRQTMQQDGSWQEVQEVASHPAAPEWYAPARFRIWESACIAGYCLELGYTELWTSAVRYVRNAWAQMPPAEVPHPYWAALLLLGRSHADVDRSIAADCIDALGRFIRRERIDPADCSWLIEILDMVDPPQAPDLMCQLADILAAHQDPDGGVNTEYGDQMRPSATFNALMAIALMAQRGLVV